MDNAKNTKRFLKVQKCQRAFPFGFYDIQTQPNSFETYEFLEYAYLSATKRKQQEIQKVTVFYCNFMLSFQHHFNQN